MRLLAPIGDRRRAAMATKAAVLREDWATAEQIERVQLQLLEVVDFINRFHTSVKIRLAVLNKKMTSVEKNLRHVENAVRKARPSSE